MAELLEGFMTEAECAKELGFSVRTLQIWRTRGKGPPVTKIGGRVRYRRTSARAWVEQCEREGSRETNKRERKAVANRGRR
jgi:predicted site-specific integrase-resolvase